MPDVFTGPPEPGTYRYVLARFDWPVGNKYQVANYSNNAISRTVEWPAEWPLPPFKGNQNPNHPTEKDRRVVMVFVGDRHLRDRCVRFQGWEDISSRWFALLEHPSEGPTPGIPTLSGIGEIVEKL